MSGHHQALGGICSCPAFPTLVMYKGLPEGPTTASSLSYAKLPKLERDYVAGAATLIGYE